MSSEDPDTPDEEIQVCKALVAKEVMVSIGKGKYKKTIYLPETFRPVTDQEDMAVDQDDDHEQVKPDAEPEKKVPALNLSKLRISNDQEDKDTSIISDTNLSNTAEVTEYPENADRAAEKIMEEIDSSTCHQFDQIPDNLMALLDDSRRSAMNDSMAQDHSDREVLTSTPARPSSSSSSANSSHPSMPPLLSSSTRDSGRSSASECSDNAFVPQELVKRISKKDLLSFIDMINNLDVVRTERNSDMPGKTIFMKRDFIFIYLSPYLLLFPHAYSYS